MIIKQIKIGSIKTKYSLCLFPKRVWKPSSNHIPDELIHNDLWDSDNKNIYWFQPVKMLLISSEEYGWHILGIEPVSFKEYLNKGNKCKIK